MGRRGYHRSMTWARASLSLGILLGTTSAALAQPAPGRAELAREAKAAEEAARDHQRAVAGIVHVYYKDQRQRLARSEIAAEKARRAETYATKERLEREASASPGA